MIVALAVTVAAAVLIAALIRFPPVRPLPGDCVPCARTGTGPDGRRCPHCAGRGRGR